MVGNKLRNLIYSVEQIFSGQICWIINLSLDSTQIYVSHRPLFRLLGRFLLPGLRVQMVVPREYWQMLLANSILLSRLPKLVSVPRPSRCCPAVVFSPTDSSAAHSCVRQSGHHCKKGLISQFKFSTRR